MNDGSASRVRYLGLSPRQAAFAVIVIVTIFRFFYCTWLPMLPDETYYYQWSRHLDASYFSKGPAVAYTIAAGTALFGANNLGVRFFAVLLSAGTAWQVFLLARRWYDDTAALLAVLLAGIIPLYAVGAVLMTIDPLSAFFWIWAANLFSKAIQEDRRSDWLLTGFAVGSGFLAKYLNALELVAFVIFLALVPMRRKLFFSGNFWLMSAMAIFCGTPVLWWNAQHHWASATQLGDRGHVHDRWQLGLSTFLGFFQAEALVISPLLFLALIFMAVASGWTLFRKKNLGENEGELLQLLLFLSVFLFYVVVALHVRCEPNWPAISYLTLLIILAGHWREIFTSQTRKIYLTVAYGLAWLETIALHDTSSLHLPPHSDPMTRIAGWSDIAAQVEVLQRCEGADQLLADGYKEASVLSFNLPGKPFVYALRHSPPANQFDFWPPYSTKAPHRVLWITYLDPTTLARQFNTITPLQSIEILYRGAQLRSYRIYLCENR